MFYWILNLCKSESDDSKISGTKYNKNDNSKILGKYLDI